MAIQPDLYEGLQSNLLEETHFRLAINFGATAITSYQGKHLTLVRNSAGNYTVTLPKAFRKMWGIFPGGWTLGVGLAEFGVVIVSGSNFVDTTGAITFEVRAPATGVATDPATGTSFMLDIVVSDSFLNEKFGG